LFIQLIAKSRLPACASINNTPHKLGTKKQSSVAEGTQLVGTALVKPFSSKEW